MFPGIFDKDLHFRVITNLKKKVSTDADWLLRSQTNIPQRMVYGCIRVLDCCSRKHFLYFWWLQSRRYTGNVPFLADPKLADFWSIAIFGRLFSRKSFLSSCQSGLKSQINILIWSSRFRNNQFRSRLILTPARDYSINGCALLLSNSTAISKLVNQNNKQTWKNPKYVSRWLRLSKYLTFIQNWSWEKVLEWLNG